MKRRVLWLILPLLLLAIMLGVKWRINHPTPTPDDLNVRAILTKSTQVDVYLAEALPTESKGVYARLSAQQKKSLIDSLTLLPFPMDPRWTRFTNGTRDDLEIDWIMPEQTATVYPQGHPLTYAGVNVLIALDGSRGEFVLHGYYSYPDRKYQLHPATVKQWIQILLANPQVGPALRARGLS